MLPGANQPCCGPVLPARCIHLLQWCRCRGAASLRSGSVVCSVVCQATMLRSITGLSPLLPGWGSAAPPPPLSPLPPVQSHPVRSAQCCNT